MRQRTESRRDVQRSAAVGAVAHVDCLAGVDPDAHSEREVEVGIGLFNKDALHVHRGSNRLPGRLEDGQSLVAPDLDHAACPSVDDLLDDVLELRGEARSCLVAVLLGETRVAANVGDQKRLDCRAFFGHLFEYRTLSAPGTSGSSSRDAKDAETRFVRRVSA